jgi:hypothetical protein
MEKITILNHYKDPFEVQVLRYFVMGDAKILLYTLNEKDEEGNVRIYATKILNKQTQPLSDEEWTYVKASIRTIVTENRDNLPLTVLDLNYSEVEGMVFEHVKVFKLAGTILGDLSANKKKFTDSNNKNLPSEDEKIKIPSFEADEINKFAYEGQNRSGVGNNNEEKDEDSFVEMLNQTQQIMSDQNADSPVISRPETVDYKSMYEQAEQEKKKLQEELFDLENKTISYQIKYDQIKKILEGNPIGE